MAHSLTASGVTKLKPTSVRREIPDVGSGGLKLVIQPSGAKSWAMRFRRPDGRMAKLTLGPLDLSGKEVATEPKIGQPLTLAAARALAAEINRQRARDRDVVAEHRIDKQRRRAAIADRGANSFGQAAQDFTEGRKVKRTGRRPRRWIEDARMLGLDYSSAGGKPTTIKGSLCHRWHNKPIAEINCDDVYLLIEEARRDGIPGLARRNGGVSDARGRRMADTLATLFGWLKVHRRIAVDPCIGAHRPSAPISRDRVLNVKSDVRNADELRWFWTACDAVGQPFGVLCKVLLLTGCRLNEIARMTRDELSDDLAMLRLSGERTKNARAYDVPLPTQVRGIIKGLDRGGCAFIFNTNNRTPVSGFSKYKARLDAIMLAEAKKELGEAATIPSWRLHDLRRTAATGMASIGVAPHVVEAALNHVSGAKAGVAGTYNREQYEPEKRAALQRWADYTTGIVTGHTAKVVPMRGSK